jgi:hypothetical protein
MGRGSTSLQVHDFAKGKKRNCILNANSRRRSQIFLDSKKDFTYISKIMTNITLTTAIVVRKAAWLVIAVAEGDSINF